MLTKNIFQMKRLNIYITFIVLSTFLFSQATEKVNNKTITIQSTSSTAKSLDGEWTMLTIRNKDVNTRDRAFIHFNINDSIFYGNNGCNVINGNVSIVGSNKIKFDNIITTMMECHNGTSERTVMKALNDISSYKITEENGIRYLTLMNSRGQNIIYLKNHDINFINGAWIVTSINNESVTYNNMRLVIDVQEMKIHANSGCNIINGTLHIDPYKDWGVEFQELISTRKMCPDIHLETALLVALEETMYCKKLGSGEIALLDRDKKQIATLKRLNLR